MLCVFEPFRRRRPGAERWRQAVPVAHRRRWHPRVYFSAVVAVATLVGASCQRRPEASKAHSVVLVVVDTLRADRLGLYGYERPTSPHIDRWARTALVFERAQATSSWTLPSFGSILTGRWASAHGAGAVGEGASHRMVPAVSMGPPRPGPLRAFSALDLEVATVPEILRDAGIATGAIVNNTFLHPDFGLSRGFESYDYRVASNLGLRRADAVVDDALAWIAAAGDKRFFLLVHFFDPHMNYDPPPEVAGAFTTGIVSQYHLPVEDVFAIRRNLAALTPNDRSFISAAYDEEILFVDRQLGRLFDGLRAEGAESDALVILTADHGEELFDHGGFEHGHTMFQEVLHVPLMLAGPGIPAGRTSLPVSLVDLAPTIFDALGLEPRVALDGQSLLSSQQTAGVAPSASRFLVAEGNLFGEQRWAGLLWPTKLQHDIENGTDRLYDLAQDPHERHDLSVAQGDRVTAMGGKMSELLEQAQRSTGERRAVAIDPAVRERLRSLGYIE